MPTFSGTVRSSDGVRTIDVTPNDVVTFTPSGTYTVEYPIGTAVISASTVSGTLTGNTSATQMRIACASGSVAFSCVDGNDETKTLTAAEAVATKALVSAAGSFTVNSRDGLGRATSFTDTANVTYTVTYGNFGPVTVSGNGQTRTYSYNAAGQMTSFAAS